MKRLGLLVLAALVMTTGCDDDPATAPSSLPIVFSAAMNTANETTAVTGAETSAQGAAQITFNVTRDASNNITGGTVEMFFQVANLPTTSSLILAHIHVGPAGVAGPFVVNTNLTPATAVPVQGNGSAQFSVTVPVQSADVLNQIIANPAGYYFNVHSALHPAGVVRGQLVRIQ